PAAPAAALAGRPGLAAAIRGVGGGGDRRGGGGGREGGGKAPLGGPAGGGGGGQGGPAFAWAWAEGGGVGAEPEEVRQAQPDAAAALEGAAATVHREYLRQAVRAGTARGRLVDRGVRTAVGAEGGGVEGREGGEGGAGRECVAGDCYRV